MPGDEPDAPRPRRDAPVDPDLVDPPFSVSRGPSDRRADVSAAVLGAISIGGVIGACARYGAGLTWPTAAGTFPSTTLTINLVGCALIGILMVIVIEAVPGTHPLVRPFLGTGVLGGFTTFSAYAVDAERLSAGGHPGLALGYLAATVATALAAVWAGTVAARAVWHALGRRRGVG